MTRWAEGLRQLRYPKELRIEAESMALTDEDLGALIDALGADATAASFRQIDPDFAVKVGTLAWRLSQRLAGLSEGCDSSWLTGRFAMLMAVLESVGIEVRDYSGKSFDPNDNWDDVIAGQGKKRAPVIVRMQHPRVLLDGRTVQLGTPIVEDEEPTDPTEHRS